MFIGAAALVLSSCTTTGVNYHKFSEGENFPRDDSIEQNYRYSDAESLKVLTLNIAHGRNQTANQIFLGKSAIENNLRAVADVLRKSNADVVALQEADGPSLWSGNFDHVAFLAREAGFPWYFRANHAESWLFSYGTAILSRLPVDEIMQHTFRPSPPTLNKGFLLGRVKWHSRDRTDSTTAIDIVSVHLDYSRDSVRDTQIAEMKQALAGRDGPMIILGDFNSEWFAEKSAVKQLAENNGMSVHMHDAKNQPTYNDKYRLDWILISSDLVFVNHRVLPDIISDHRAILAEIGLKKQPATTLTAPLE